MDEREFAAFTDNAFAAFPGLKEWLTEKSPNVPVTLAAWRKTLANVTYDEAASVLDGWLTGTIHSPPVGYKRELFAIDIRSIVQRQRDDARREEVRQEIFVKALAGRYKRPSSIVKLSPYFARILDVGTAIKAGTIGEDDGADQLASIVAEGCEAIDAEDRAKSYR